MADIFISYANEDRDTVARLAAHLESVGWQVWWDRRIPAGRTWRSVLAEALVDSRCMIVLWSENSVESPWVAEEAEEARRLGKTLVPVLIRRVEPPMGFRTIQAADLSRWDGSADHAAVLQLVADLRSLIGAPDHRAVPKAESSVVSGLETNKFFSSWYSTHGAKIVLAILAVAVFAFLWHNRQRGKPEIPAPLPGTEPGTEAVEPRRLTSLSVTGGRKNLEPLETVKLTVTGRYSDGSPGEVTESVQWSSSNTQVATVDEHGQVTALGAGTTRIVAKLGGVESSEWTLDVSSAKPAVRAQSAPALVGLRISANRKELFEEERIALRVKGKYSDESEKLLSKGIEWQISDRQVASINSGGELIALRPGKVEVVARADRLTSAPLALSIKERGRIPEAPAKVVKAVESPAPKPAMIADQAKARIATYIDRAASYREQGDYAAALAELEKAKAIDSANEDILKQIEQTKRACNAEKLLGSKPDC